MAAILFLHGIPGSGRDWDGVIARLGARHRCLAPDLPGFGGSAPPERLSTLADVRHVTEEMAARLAPPDRFALVVHDVGGVFGLAWAAARPERVERLIILNSSVFPDRRWHWGARIVRTPVLGDLAMRLQPRRAFRAEMRRASAGNLSDAAIDRTFDAFDPAARKTTVRLYRMQSPALLGGLPDEVRALTLRVPALVIWGGRDPYLPESYARRFGAREVRVHADLGHWPHREAPDRIADEIDDFLAAHRPCPE